MTVKRTESVRSVARALEILRTLNRLNGATANKVAAATGLPRATVYRLLETLETEGYISRHADGRFRATALVRGLGDGYEDETWVRDIAMPPIQRLGDQIKWPLGLSTLHGTQLLVRETTDRSSVLALKRYSTGHRLSLLTTASGRVYMAFTTDDNREALLSILAQSDDPKDWLARDPAAFSRILADVRDRGFAHSSTPVEGESAIAVPVFTGDRLLATLALRYIDSALSKRQVIERYVDLMQTTAEEVGGAFAEAARTPQAELKDVAR